MSGFGEFKYVRRTSVPVTAEFSFEEVVTPGAKKLKKRKKVLRAKAKPPKHDPNAKTRPSKHRKREIKKKNYSPTVSDQRPKKKARRANKGRKKSKVREERLIAPMYPTDIISSTEVRSKTYASIESNKLHALFQEVFRSEITSVSKNFKGKFQFVVNALKGVTRDFMQTLCDQSQSTTNGRVITRNSRNIELQNKKKNIESVLSQFRKEEEDWTTAKERIMNDRKQKENVDSQSLHLPIDTKNDQNEIANVEAALVQSVQGISIQLDTIQQSLVVSRLLSDASLQTKDKLSEDFANYTQHRNGIHDSPRKLLKNLLGGSASTVKVA
jgi:hypothetical protein